MNRFWSSIIQPILEGINAEYIVEIGSDTGINTQNILEYCLEYDVRMTAIDPFPSFDINEFKDEYNDKFDFYRELSLSRLPLLEDYDVILLDGDHNWYTVYNELKIIEKSFKNKRFPVVFLHDVGWPYARRDLYYNPENIPEAYRQPYKKLGMYPDQTDLKEEGGLNSHLNNSIYENNPKNGVLTAVEDFIDESCGKFSFKFINAFHGLGILFSNDEIENIIKKVIEDANLLDSLEEERLKLKIANSEERIRNISIKKEFNHNKMKLKNVEGKLKLTEGKLKSSNKSIQEKEKELSSVKIQFNQAGDKLKLTENKLNESNERVKEKKKQLKEAEIHLKSSNALIQEKDMLIDKVENELEQTKSQLELSNQLINEKENQLKQANGKIESSNQIIHEKEKQLEEARNQLNMAKYKFNQIDNQLKSSNVLIQEKQNIIANMGKKEKKLVKELNNFKVSLIKMEHSINKNKSITQRLFSKFPGLYILLNMNETGIKNALINIKGYKSIKNNNLFDTGFYLKNNNGIRASGMDPILHYIYHGFGEGKKPNPAFDADYYLKKYNDVKKSNLNPLVHYSLYGIKEGRKINISLIKEESTKYEDIKGHINGFNGSATVKGWLAKIGDNIPRVAVLKIDDQNFEFICDNFRLDLKGKVNNGCHAFEFIVPLNFLDNKKHKIQLFDKETGKLITKTEAKWSQERHFSDFSGFLANSLVSPVINAPFREEDKRCFAVMENIAKYLTNLASNAEENILVSVIMPVYNRVDTVKYAIDSVLNQTYSNFELIIVDDGSDDGTVELIENIKDNRIVLIHNENCQGVSKARNKALKAAKGKYIAYLDSDNTWDSRYLAAMVGAFLRLPDAEAVYSGQLLFKGNSEKPFAVRFGSFNPGLLLNRNYIDMNAFCHTRDIYDRLGGFDENLKRYVDWDLIIRISESAKMYSIPVILSNYCYDKADNTITNNASFVHHQEILREKQKGRLKHLYSTFKSKTHLSKVSIVIPSYESLDDIRECIEAILIQDNDWVDIIVVDNASSLPVVNYLREMADAGKIKFVQNKINYGFTYAVNQGIAVSKPDHDIIILNNDAIMMPGAIEAMQKAAHELPRCGVVVPQQVLPGGTKTINTHVPHANPQCECDVNLSAHHANIINVPLFHSGESLELSFAPFFCAYIKRDILDRSVGLDAEFGRHYRSDRIFCNYILHVMNLKIYHVAKAVVYHKLQKSTDALSKKSDNNSNFDMIFRKNQWDAELAAELGYNTAKWDF